MVVFRVNSGMRCAKFMLLIVTFMFAVTGLLLIMVGTTIQAIIGDFRQFVYGYYLTPSSLMIASGVFMILASALGAYGSMKESVLLINLYGVFLFLIFVLEMVAAFAAFALQGDIRITLIDTMNDSLNLYEDNCYVGAAVDYLQSGLQCCGIDGPFDWKTVYSPNQNLTLKESFEVIVPTSCCGRFSTEDPEICLSQFQDGCLNRLDFVISQSAMLIATGASTVAFVQLLGVLCAFMLAKTLRRKKSIREARRWQLQQSLGILISGSKIDAQNSSSGLGYTQLEKSEKYLEQGPVTYSANSPSVN